MSLDLHKAREIFEQSTDFTGRPGGGVPDHRFRDAGADAAASTRLFDAAQEDEVLGASVAGELISSEIEIRSGRGENFPHAVALQDVHRRKLFALAAERGVRLGSIGAHPFSPWQDQEIIDTEHYRLVYDGLQVRRVAQQHLQPARSRRRARRRPRDRRL